MAKPRQKSSAGIQYYEITPRQAPPLVGEKVVHATRFPSRNSYRPSPTSASMSSAEFFKLAGTGFESKLRLNNRTDVASFLSPPCAIGLGWFGALSLCPPKVSVVGARLKISVSPSVTTGEDREGLTGVYGQFFPHFVYVCTSREINFIQVVR